MLIILDKQMRSMGVISNDSPKAMPYFNDEHTEELETHLSLLQFDVPSTHPSVSLIESKGYILYTDLDGKKHLFTIVEISDTHSSEKLRTVYCEHCAVDDLLYHPVRPIKMNSWTLKQAVDYILDGSGWELGENSFSGVKDFEFSYTNAREALFSVVEEFEAEVEFEAEFNGTKVSKKLIHVIPQRGRNTKKIFEYDNNLTSVNRIKDSRDVITAIIGVGRTDSEGNILTFSNYNPPADERYKRIQDYILDEQANNQFNSGGKPKIGFHQDSEAETDIELYRNSLVELRKRNTPKITYECSVVTLERITGLEHHSIRIGDTVVVKDFSFSPVLVLEARIVKLVRCSTDPSGDSVVLGDYKRIEITQNSAIANIQKKILEKEAIWNQTGEVIPKQSTPPENPLLNTLWLDTGVIPNILRRWNGEEWEYATPVTPEHIGAFPMRDGLDLTDLMDGISSDVEKAIEDARDALEKAEGADGKVDTAIGEIEQLEDVIAEKVDITVYNAEMVQVQNELGAKVAKTLYDADKLAQNAINNGINGKISSIETNIDEVEGQLSSKVSNTTYEADKNGMMSRLSSAETGIQQNANAITAKASQLEVDAVKDRVTSAESQLTIQAGQIQSKVSQTDHNALSGRVDGVTTRISSAESTITQQAGQIASKVSQTDFNTLSGRVGTAESTITQQAGEIAQRVTQTQLTNSINGMKIGGRNLIPNASFKNDAEGWEIDTTTHSILENDYRDTNALLLQSTGQTVNVWKGASRPLTRKDHIKRDTDYVLSGWIYVYGDSPMDAQVGIEVRGKNATNTSVNVSLGTVIYNTSTAKNQWLYFERVMKNTSTDIVSAVINPWIEKNGKIKIAMLQLEEGNKATNFTNAPEDAEILIDIIGTRLSNAEEIITDDAIVNKVISSTSFANTLSEKADVSQIGNLASLEDLTQTADNLREDINLAIRNQDFSPYVQKTELEQTKDEFNFTIANSGGVNLLRNSVGYADKDLWNMISGQNIQIIQNNELDAMGYGSGFRFNASSGFKAMRQTLNVVVGQQYTISWHIDKPNITMNSNNYVIIKAMDSNGWSISETIYGETQVTNGYVFNSLTFTANTPVITIEISGGSTAIFSITGLMLNVGDVPLQWTMAHGEIYNTNVKININGIKVHNSSSSSYTIMSPEEFSGYAEVDGQMQRVFTLNDDVTEVSKLDAEKEIAMSPVKIIPITSGGYNGWAFIKSQ